MNPKKQNTSSIENIYRIDGRVPVSKAIPFGLQHVLAMFVSNLAPITIVAAAAQPALSQEQVGMLLQNAMFIAGLATLIQLYPIWKIGSRLPIVMGISFTFVTILCTIAANYGYPTMLGAVFVGGILEGTIGLFGRRLFGFIKPIVAACVVSGIGLSLFTVGVRSFGGGYADDFGSPANLIIGATTLIVCLIWSALAKGYLKQLSVLAGLIVGYVISIFLGKIDFSSIMSGGLISFPHFLMFIPKFNVGA
ncbi:MAG: purine permease, partial [Lachnospiraceae bacterium]|nr:purine permease [Lachnospiraceae bacterium]